jgi:hypothetical protein
LESVVRLVESTSVSPVRVCFSPTTAPIRPARARYAPMPSDTETKFPTTSAFPPKHLELDSRKSGQHRHRTTHAGWDIIAGRDDPHARRRTQAQSPQAGAHQAATSSGCTCATIRPG